MLLLFVLMIVEGAFTLPAAHMADSRWSNLLVFEKTLDQMNHDSKNDDYNKNKEMDRHFLQDEAAVCNDGTHAGYYLRRSLNASAWVIYLEGGGFCHDDLSCMHRYYNVVTRPLMSSNLWPSVRYGIGIQSASKHSNPLLWNANHVYIPYCTSDFWSGNKTAKQSHGPYSFMGHTVFNAVIEDLLAKGLDGAGALILTGSSAGATGVLLHIDDLHSRLARQKPSIRILGLLDSALFYPDDCSVPTSFCYYVLESSLKMAQRNWNPVLPKNCFSGVSSGTALKCLVGTQIFKSVAAPILVFQWLFDNIIFDQSGPVERLGPTSLVSFPRSFRNFLRSIPAKSIFAPACIDHTILYQGERWRTVKVSGISLEGILRCWINERGDQVRASSACLRNYIDVCTWANCNPTCFSVKSGRYAVKYLMDPDWEEVEMSWGSVEDEDASVPLPSSIEV